MKLEPVVLEGTFVRLEPLAQSHHDELCQVIRDGELWKLSVTLVPHPDEVVPFIEDALKGNARGEELAFVTVDRASGRVVGSTRFMKYHRAYKRVEIGFTFLAASWQRTHANTEAKLLMLRHGFEHLQLNRVELITDVLNTKSRNAIQRLGASEEGVLRQHMVMRDGRIRDSVIFSLIAPEWPSVKQRLEARLAAGAGSQGEHERDPRSAEHTAPEPNATEERALR